MKRALATLLYSVRRGAIVLFVLLGYFQVDAQYIAIEDDNFEEFVETRYPSIYRSDTLGGALDTVLAATIPNGQSSYINQGVVSMDEIRHFKRIDTINFSRNQIVQIESFKGLRSVDYLNLAENQLTSLTNVDRLVSLKHLVARDNFLTELPQNMGLLKDTLERVNLSNNSITAINFDITEFNNLQWFIIENNYLSFEEILLIQAVEPNLNNIFPQKDLPLQFDSIKVNEGDEFTFTIPYDQSLAGITYALMKDNVKIDSSETGTFDYTADLTQTGTYHIEITSVQIDGYSILTESFVIDVTPSESTDSPYSPDNNQDAVLSPNGDGIQDFYEFQADGAIQVYDSAGRLVNEFQIPQSWDVTDSNGNLLKPGYYLIVKNGSSKEYITVQY